MILPDEFVRQMHDLLPYEELERFVQSITQEDAPTSIRLNPAKPIDPPTGSEPVTWCSDGYYLSERPSFTLDPLFHAGCYYVQEASSMYLAEILKIINNKVDLAGKTVLDLCAAPGGKSTLLLSHLPEDTLVVCNEVVRNRAQILRENIIKWGHPNAVVTSNEARDFQPLGALFDLILCDAPCSGEGMFRKDPQSIQQWSPANVNLCQRRQRDILTDIWPCLRTDGLLVYSTCTYNKKENEENVEWLCQTLGAELLHSRRFMPHLSRGEGLFIALLRKTSPSPSPVIKQKKRQTPAPVPSHLATWFQTPAPYVITTSADGSFYAFAQSFAPVIEHLRQHLYTLHFGIQLATLKGKDKLQPSHSLAMSKFLNRSKFTTVEITLDTALSYLRTEAITLSSTTPRGYTLLTYQGHPLGFVNNLGSRANNLYPSEWRIRKQ